MKKGAFTFCLTILLGVVIFPLPGRAVSFSAEMIEKKVRTECTEVVSGQDCWKMGASLQGADFMTVWISKEFGFPMRIRTF